MATVWHEPHGACAFIKARYNADISPRTLQKYRLNKQGPAFRRWARRIVYAEPDLVSWAEGRLSLAFESTSDTGTNRPVKLTAAPENRAA
jgi:hypothetical protein